MKAPKALTIFISIACVALVAVLTAVALGATTWAALIPAVASLISTFLGASFAFNLNSDKERRKSEKEKIAAIRLALFIIELQRNALGTIWNELKDSINLPDRVINLPPSLPPDYSHLRQDILSLSFMISDEPNLLMALSIEGERFRQTIFALSSHKEYHVQELQPAIAASGIYEKTFTLEELKEAVGERIFGTALTHAEQVAIHLSSTRKSLQTIGPRLHAFAKSLYPSEKFITVKLPDED